MAFQPTNRSTGVDIFTCVSLCERVRPPLITRLSRVVKRTETLPVTFCWRVETLLLSAIPRCPELISAFFHDPFLPIRRELLRPFKKIRGRTCKTPRSNWSESHLEPIVCCQCHRLQVNCRTLQKDVEAEYIAQRREKTRFHRRCHVLIAHNEA